MIYYFSIVLLFFLSFIHILEEYKIRYKLFSYFVFVLFLVLGGLRFNVGADWGPYNDLYESVDNIEDIITLRYEPLYVLINYVIKIIYNNFSFFIFLVFLFSFVLKVKVIYKYTPDIFISLIIYFYTVFLIYDINGLRQGIALGITLYSIIFIVNRSVYKFLLLVLIAALFHKSAIIFIPFYWLANLKIKNITTGLFLFVFIIISIPVRDFFRGSNLFNYLLFSDSFVHYSSYLTSDYQSNIPLISFSIFQRIFVFSFFLLFISKIKIDNRLKILLKNGYLIGIILFLLFSFSAEMAARLSFYYKSMEIIMIPFIILSPKKKEGRLLLLIMFTIFALIGLYRLLSIPNGHLLPYNNILINLL